MSNIHAGLVDFISEQYDENCVIYNPLKNIKDAESGCLSTNIGIINIDEDNESAFIDIRQPVTIPFSEIEEQIIKNADKYDLHYERKHYLAPLYVDRNSELVCKLSNSFNKVTGLDLPPQSCGGGTICKSI